MKKLLVPILTIIMSLTLILTASARGNIYTFNGMTIEFSDNSSFTPATQAAIVQMIVNDEEIPSTTTYNLLCTLFGHKESTESFTIIEHCVSDTAPRCLKSLQDVTACTRCETVIDIYVVGEVYIFCCD